MPSRVVARQGAEHLVGNRFRNYRNLDFLLVFGGKGYGSGSSRLPHGSEHDSLC